MVPSAKKITRAPSFLGVMEIWCGMKQRPSHKNVTGRFIVPPSLWTGQGVSMSTCFSHVHSFSLPFFFLLAHHTLLNAGICSFIQHVQHSRHVDERKPAFIYHNLGWGTLGCIRRTSGCGKHLLQGSGKMDRGIGGLAPLWNSIRLCGEL